MKAKGSLRAISMVMALLLFVLMAVPAYAGDNLGLVGAGEMVDIARMSILTQNASDFVSAHDGVLNMDQAPIMMYNLNNEVEALYFRLEPTGYVIVSYGDGHVVEYSPNAERNIAGFAGKVYYVGPLEYYIASGDDFTHIVMSETVQRTDFTMTYHVTRVANDQLRVEYRHAERVNASVSTPVHYVSATTANGYYCTITAISNLLQWYADFKSADMYAFDFSNITELREGLDYYGYIYNGALDLDDVKGNHWGDGTLHHGLQSYFNRSDVDDYEVVSADTLLAQVKNQIQIYRRPVLLTIDTVLLEPDVAGRHAVMAYAYENIGSTTYYYVNDGWGSNGVELCCDDIPTSYPMLYIR